MVMPLKSQKDTNQPSVEGLLNDIYEMPDLQEDVFSYLNPVLLKAYGLLSRDKCEDVRLFEHEDRRQLENILFHDLPELINLYAQMPIAYRNEKKLKTGQTHREVLINNIKLLVKSIQGLEAQSFTNVDQDMNVKTRVYQEKYKTALAYEAEMESESENQFTNRFNWNKYQEQHQPDLTMKNLETMYGKNRMEHFIRVRDGKIEYQAKDRVKAVIKAVREVMTVAKKVAQSLWKDYRGVMKPVLIIGGIVFAGYSLIHHMNYKYRHFTAVRELSEAVTPLYNNPTPLMHDLTVKMLGGFAQEHQDSGAQLIFDAQQTKVTISEKMTKNECLNFIDQAQNNYPDGMFYRINDNLYNSKQNLPDQMQNMICINPGNTLTVTYLLRNHK
jgi:hypothetical protein